MACIAPEILDFAYEGSLHLLVGADGIENGTEIQLSTGEIGIASDGKAVIVLSEPLKLGDSVYAFIDGEDCTIQGCAISVNGVENPNICTVSVDDLPFGYSTGKMICKNGNLWLLVSDGEGGMIEGHMIQESSKICGGIHPNCEPTGDLPRYYNVMRCSSGIVYQTSTNLGAYATGQRVSHAVYGTLRYEGSYVETTTPPNPIGTVTIAAGSGCVAYYNLVSCGNGQIYQCEKVYTAGMVETTMTIPNQRVSTPQGEHYWDGTMTYTPTALRTNVVVLAGELMCS